MGGSTLHSWGNVRRFTSSGRLSLPVNVRVLEMAVYSKHHNMNITDHNQPLLVHIPKKKEHRHRRNQVSRLSCLFCKWGIKRLWFLGNGSAKMLWIFKIAYYVQYGEHCPIWWLLSTVIFLSLLQRGLSEITRGLFMLQYEIGYDYWIYVMKTGTVIGVDGHFKFSKCEWWKMLIN